MRQRGPARTPRVKLSLLALYIYLMNRLVTRPSNSFSAPHLLDAYLNDGLLCLLGQRIRSLACTSIVHAWERSLTTRPM